MSPLLAAGCVVELVHTALAVDAGLWDERTRYEIRASPSCARVTWELPASATLVDLDGRIRYSDDTKKPLAPRWSVSPRGADGAATLDVALPDLLEGDRLIVDIRRVWSGPSFAFEPGDAASARLDPPKGAAVDGRAPAKVDAAATITHPEARGGAAHPSGPPAGNVRREQRLTLLIPAGDPQLKLYPGGGSAVRVNERLTFPPSALEQSLALPIAADAAATFDIQPPHLATVERGPESALIRVRASETAVRVGATWDQPDAPTFGEAPEGVDTYEVSAPGGEVRWEGRGWALARVGDRPILPDGEVVIRALENRFRRAALPEPGLPQALRGRTRSWDLVADLRPTLFERATPGLPGDPLWPRPLVKARGSGAVTDAEAMLIVWVYAAQAGLQADWALARAADRGPGFRTTPAGYDRPILRFDAGDASRWVDPSCGVCGPFELPPELEGADVLSPAALRTPEPTPGASVVSTADGQVTWELAGPAALRLRQWFAELAPTDRGGAVAERLGGTGARLVSIEGAEAAGAPIRVTATVGSGVPLDPLVLPPPDEHGVWVDWIGERALSTANASDDTHGAELTTDALQYVRTVEAGIRTERLIVHTRLIPATDARALAALRMGL